MGETRALADYLVLSRLEDIPADVRHEALRALVNYVGCALGGANEAAVDIAIRVFAPFSGPATAAVLGRGERFDPLHASLMNGLSSHVHDYDDTTPKNYMHPTSPVASALFAYASANPVSGADFVHAFILGFEAESRIGDAVYPSHYDIGWHITGTAGVFGAAAAIGRLEALSAQQMVWALGLAGTQAAGLREMFGSMGKAFHPGRAAQNGYGAALLAKAGFTSGEHGLEGPRGFAAVQSAAYDLARITAGFGTDFSLRANTYKPFPCGIVNHPAIDACIHIHDEHGLAPEAIRSVRLHVAPLVMDLCGKTGITLGLQGKFSVVHGAAVGLVRGRAGLQEYTDEAVNDPAVKRVREATVAAADPTVTEDGVVVEVVLADGRTIEKRLEHSLGNLARPMSDAQLDEKFLAQAVLTLPRDRAERLLAMTWEMDRAGDLGEMIATAVP